MAIVIPTKNHENITLLKRVPRKISVCSHMSTKDCLYTQATNFKAKQDLKKGVQTKNLDNNLVKAASINANNSNEIQNSVHEKRTARPIGLITLDDLIGTIFQRTYRDEKDISGHCSDNSPTKNEFRHKICYVNDAFNINLTRSEKNPQHLCKNHTKYDEDAFINGVNDRRFHYQPPPGLDNHQARNNRENRSTIKLGDSINDKKTDSSRTRFVSQMRGITSLLDLRLSSFDNNQVTTLKNNTFPSREKSLISVEDPIRYSGASTVVSVLPKLSRITSISRKNESGVDTIKSHNETKQESLSHIPKDVFKSSSLPELSINPLDSNLNKFKSTYEENVSNNTARQAFLSSPHINQIADLSTHESSTLNKEENLCGKEYTYLVDHGFTGDVFGEKTEARNKENLASKYLSHTMPRSKGTNISLSPDQHKMSYDDRTLLPSQRRIALRSASLYANDHS